jgi:hypothetical protein
VKRAVELRHGEVRRIHQLGMSALVVYANTREAKESPDPADEETGPRLAKLGGACCKEVE